MKLEYTRRFWRTMKKANARLVESVTNALHDLTLHGAGYPALGFTRLLIVKGDPRYVGAKYEIRCGLRFRILLAPIDGGYLVVDVVHHDRLERN